MLRELGERLVGKPYIALGELVKNAYDADATKCVIHFGEDAIEIVDNGNGMSHDDFVKKWMRIGSTHKRMEMKSPVLKRVLTGSKGIGRLSAQFLGAKIEVRSVSRDPEVSSVLATVDWNDAYTKGTLIQAGAWVKDEEERDILGYGFAHGTNITIRGLKDRWDIELLKALAAELWFLQPPSELVSSIAANKRFKVEVKGIGESDTESFESETKKALNNWIARIDGSVDKGRIDGKAIARIKFKQGKTYMTTYDLPNKALDKAKFQILIFKLSGRQPSGISLDKAREYFKEFGGVHIYDNGFRLPYYGGDEQDWLGVEIAHSHRKILSDLVPINLRPENGSLQDLPTLGRVFGFVEVSTAHESETAQQASSPSKILTVQVTRDKLIDNKAYEDLKYFVRRAFDYYSYQSTSLRAQEKIATAGEDVSNLTPQINIIRLRAEELKQKVPSQFVVPLERAIDEFAQSESKRQQSADAERILLASLATAGMGALALQHELAKELYSINQTIKEIQSQVNHASFPPVLRGTIISLRDWVESAQLTRKMFSPLFDREDREEMSKLRVKRLIKRLSANFAPLLRGIAIETNELPENLQFPNGTVAGWNAVFQNIFVNSVNAMLDSPTKRIRCRAEINKQGYNHLFIEDTGVGVDLKNSENLFKPFVRKLKIPKDRQALGLGGMGLGLTIVQMVGKTFGCAIRFCKPKSPFKTSLEIMWKEEK